MILLLFALFDLLAGMALVGTHMGWLPLKMTIGFSAAVMIKAFIFNDKFLSILDMLAAIYMIVELFVQGGFFYYFFTGYFVYKFLVSMF